jgi:hypothetical protein
VNLQGTRRDSTDAIGIIYGLKISHDILRSRARSHKYGYHLIVLTNTLGHDLNLEVSNLILRKRKGVCNRPKQRYIPRMDNLQIIWYYTSKNQTSECHLSMNLSVVKLLLTSNFANTNNALSIKNRSVLVTSVNVKSIANCRRLSHQNIEYIARNHIMIARILAGGCSPISV